MRQKRSDLGGTILEELDDTTGRIFIRGCGLSCIVDDCSTAARTFRQPSTLQPTIDEAVKLLRRRVHAILHLVAVGVHECHGDLACIVILPRVNPSNDGFILNLRSFGETFYLQIFHWPELAPG